MRQRGTSTRVAHIADPDPVPVELKIKVVNQTNLVLEVTVDSLTHGAKWETGQIAGNTPFGSGKTVAGVLSGQEGFSGTVSVKSASHRETAKLEFVAKQDGATHQEKGINGLSSNVSVRYESGYWTLSWTFSK